MVDTAVYRIELVVEEPLHIGSGEKTGNLLHVAKIPLVWSVGRGIHSPILPIIPRSSLRGVLRALAERIAHAYYVENDTIPAKLARLHHQPTLEEVEERKRYRNLRLLVASPLHTPQDTPVPEVFEKRRCSVGVELAVPSFDNQLAKVLCEYAELVPEQRWRRLAELLQEHADRLYEEMASLLCPICRLFGSQLLGGALRFTDLLPVDSEAALGYRNHVSIERGRGIRAADRLYRIEYVEPGTTFTGYMLVVRQPHETILELSARSFDVLDEAWREAEKLLGMLIKYLESTNTVVIGGHKSRGYGLARIRVERIA